MEEEQPQQQREEQESFTETEDIDNNEIQAYSSPELRFDVQPYRTYHFSRQFRSSSNPYNFLKSVKWSPDGSCFLTKSDDNSLRLFSLPDNENDYPAGSFSSGPDEDMTSCVFATTTRDHPVHLWDSTTATLYISSL